MHLDLGTVGTLQLMLVPDQPRVLNTTYMYKLMWAHLYNKTSVLMNAVSGFMVTGECRGFLGV